MAEGSLSDSDITERSKNDHCETVNIDSDRETGGNTGENGINIIFHRNTENTTKLYGVKNYESLGKS